MDIRNFVIPIFLYEIPVWKILKYSILLSY